MTDEKGETWSPSGMSKVRSRPESVVADCSMHVLQPPYVITEHMERLKVCECKKMYTALLRHKIHNSAKP